jgi:hypothetical protein
MLTEPYAHPCFRDALSIPRNPQWWDDSSDRTWAGLGTEFAAGRGTVKMHVQVLLIRFVSKFTSYLYFSLACWLCRNSVGTRGKQAHCTLRIFDHQLILFVGIE